MFKRILKLLGILLAVLVGIVVIAFIAIYILSQGKINKTYDIQVEAVTIPDDAESVARGEYLVRNLSGCDHCHGDNLGGDMMIDNVAFGKIHAPNLTSGEGGAGAVFNDEDWVRALRHGVNEEGKGLVIMPSKDYYNFNDADLGAVIAYLKSLAPVDNETPEVSLGPIGRLIVVASGEALLPAEGIDHTAARPEPVEVGVTAEYGGYLASLACAGCHGENLSGRPSQEPGAPESANLTPSGIARFYTLETFTEVLRTGVTQSGRDLDEDNMPWTIYKGLTDEDIEALWSYIQTLPAKEFNEE